MDHPRIAGQRRGHIQFIGPVEDFLRYLKVAGEMAVYFSVSMGCAKQVVSVK